MPPKNQALSNSAKDEIRKAALARHAARKEAGLPAPSGQPYKTPDAPAVAPTPVTPPAPAPTPRVILKDDGTLSLPKPSPPVVTAPEPPRPLPDPAPQLAFAVWLRGHEGRSACDTRLSHDPVRLGAEIEDRLRIAFLAGHAEGRAEA